jgi:hypothetical protein
MSIRTNTAFAEIFNTKPRKIFFEKNSIYLNQFNSIEIDIVDGARWIIVGDAGSGKSFCLGVMCNQFKNVWSFDPTGKFRDTIEEQGYDDKWEFLSLTPKKSKHAFKMNVRDLSDRILDSLFPRAEDTEKKRMQRQAIENFVKQPNNTYADWEKLCEESKLSTVFNDLRWVLSEDDSAPSLLELSKGRKCIDCEGISVRNPCIGVVLQSLIGARSKMSKSYRLNADNFIMVTLDEAQDYARYQTPSGEAFKHVNLQARKYGIGQILVGSAYDSIHPDCRAKSNMKFIFSSPGITDKYKREGIDIIQDDWAKLSKYECFIYSNDGQYRGAIGDNKCIPNLYFKAIKKINKIPDYIIKQDRTDFGLFSFSDFH